MSLTRSAALLAVAIVVAVGPALAAAERPPEPLVEQVRKSIDNGIRFLKRQEAGKGHWEVNLASSGRPGGWSALAMLALLNAGVKPDEPVIQRGLDTMRRRPLEDTYVVGLQAMVLAEAGFAKDKVLIQRHVDWLLAARVLRGGRLAGWSYKKGWGGATIPDNSNAQYALLGLHAGKTAGAKIDPEVWKGIQDYYLRTQQTDGGWNYMNVSADTRGTYLTMTTAGFCGLHIAGLELSAGRQGLRKDGVAERCGQYDENPALAKAVDWIDKHFAFQLSSHYTFYNVYGIERAGRLSGRRFLGQYDWYREGCKFLVSRQHDDGSWHTDGNGVDSMPVLSTSFALLFLSKGRTPILISKFAYGPGEGWNNKHNDARYLVEYASRELFKKMPLAWQVYDTRPLIGKLGERERLLEEVGTLLQSPIVFMNGHHAPDLNGQQKEILKRYIEEGGFLFAESCCGRQEFTDGFRDLMKELFPDSPLRKLKPDHAIWKANALVPPGQFPDLEGIDQGCKTVVVFSPKPLAGWYEENQWDEKAFPASKGPMAFRLAGNIIAYATGMEPPRPRLSTVEVRDERTDTVKVPRGYLKAGQLKHSGDWEPAPKAMRNLMLYLRDQVRLEVDPAKDEVGAGNNEEVFRHKFLYLHGRNEFEFSSAGMKNLRAHLSNGGLLLADACCGKERFDKSFREFAAKLFPDKKLEPIPVTDELYSKEINGIAIASVKCRREKKEGAGSAEYQVVEPFLEGIKVNGRWMVIYSKYDLGCALEKHPSSDCLGHDHESALRLAGAAVLYLLKR